MPGRSPFTSVEPPSSDPRLSIILPMRRPGITMHAAVAASGMSIMLSFAFDSHGTGVGTFPNRGSTPNSNPARQRSPGAQGSPRGRFLACQASPSNRGLTQQAHELDARIRDKQWPRHLTALIAMPVNPRAWGVMLSPGLLSSQHCQASQDNQLAPLTCLPAAHHVSYPGWAPSFKSGKFITSRTPAPTANASQAWLQRKLSIISLFP